ncbi:MAG: tRNA lysidine(34) synthetase TilS [Ignavibacteria bacterium]|nr:tRNA lysidine(34) synthetase TilS [Ignavibacteria bacterium]
MIRTIEQKVVKFILERKLISEKDRILVALSGGQDSVFLIEFLLKYKRRFKIDIAVFHLNHNLRGKESDLDVKFCKALANKKKIPFFSSSKNVKLFARRKKISIEEAGRELRYKELFQIADKKKFTKIATAHIADDNSETVLLNLIKGAGLKGLSGIPAKRDKIIRPTLVLSKDEIMDYLQRKKITYRTDRSNYESDYQRNYLRNEIIPLIKRKLNPQFNNAVLKSSEIVKNISSYIDKQIDNTINDVVLSRKKSLIINLKKLEESDTLLYGDLFRTIVQKYFSKKLENKYISELKKLINKQPGKMIEFSNGINAIRERDSIIIYLKKLERNHNKQVQLKIGDKKQFEKKILSVKEINGKEFKFSTSGRREFIEGDKLNDNFIVRKWKDGDRFYPLGMKNSKKVSDFLSEQKIESYKKKEQLVLTNSGKIVWVVGIRIDNRYKITKKTKKVVELCLI